MLLGAVTLVISFLILSSLVARVGQIPAEAARDESGLLREMEAVRVGVKSHVLGLGFSSSQLNDVLEHVVRLEGARGFILQPDDCVLTNDGVLTITLADGTGHVSFDFVEIAC